MNKQQLAAKIWQSANKMRSKNRRSQYKDYILGFIFYKFCPTNQKNLLLSKDLEKPILPNSFTESGELVDYIKENIGYFH